MRVFSICPVFLNSAQLSAVTWHSHALVEILSSVIHVPRMIEAYVLEDPNGDRCRSRVRLHLEDLVRGFLAVPSG